MAVRCCSPPESCDGVCLAWAVSPTRARRDHRRPDLPARRTGHLEREGHVLPDRLGRQELEVLEDDPDLAAHLRDLATPEAGDVLTVEDDLAACRDLIADEQFDERGLTGAGWPDKEDEVALGDDQVDVAQGQLAVRVLLGHVMQHEHGSFLRGLVAGPAEDAAADGARGAVRWGDGHIRLRGRGLRRRSPLIDAISRLRPRARQGERHRSRGYHSNRGPANATSGAAPHRAFVRSGKLRAR
jgi:Protein of unknown function (DUF1602).